MRVLFILGSYIPNASANGVCVNNVAKALIESGHEVVCLCERSRKNPVPIECIDGVEIHRVNEMFFESTYINNSGIFKGAFNPVYYLMRKGMRALEQLFWPADLQGKVKRFKEKAFEILEEKPCDYVVCVYRPYYSFFVGTAIKKKYPNIHLVMYLLDSISGGKKEKLISQKYNNKIKAEYERKAIAKSDLILAMNSSEKYMNEKYGASPDYQKIKYIDVPLYCKQIRRNADTKKEITSTGAVCKIVFCGTLNYPTRNVKYWTDVFAKVDGIKLVLIGTSNIAKYLRDVCEKSEGKIEYKGYRCHEEVQIEMENADILMNMGVTLPCAISGKIFEYMSFQKPIITTYSIDDEACIPYLKKYPFALLLDERETVEIQIRKINEFLNRVMENTKPLRLQKELLYMNTPEAFVDILKSTDSSGEKIEALSQSNIQ